MRRLPKPNIEITELFMAKADWNRTFIGRIERFKDENGHPVVFGKIKVNDGFVYAKADDDVELGEKLDEMVRIITPLINLTTKQD